MHTDRKTKKDKRECRWTSGRGSKIRSQVERLRYLGARLGTADCLFQKPARPGQLDSMRILKTLSRPHRRNRKVASGIRTGNFVL